MAFVQDIKNKVVLITGAGGGIGSGMVKAFIQEGAKHVAILDLDDVAGKELEQKINTDFGENKAKFHKCDVTKDDQLFAAFENTIEEQGSLDVVINNAGILNASEDSYKNTIEINVTAVVTGTLKALKVMGKDSGGKGGTIINVSSIAAFIMDPMLPIYHATKSAVLMFSNCIGLDFNYERTGVRVLTVCFGATETNLFVEARKAKASFDEECSKRLQNRMGTFYFQRPESAVTCLIEAYKSGVSGDTWLAVNDKPPKNITPKVKEAYGILTEVAEFHV